MYPRDKDLSGLTRPYVPREIGRCERPRPSELLLLGEIAIGSRYVRLRGRKQQTFERLHAAEVQEKEPPEIEWAHFEGQLVCKRSERVGQQEARNWDCEMMKVICPRESIKFDRRLRGCAEKERIEGRGRRQVGLHRQTVRFKTIGGGDDHLCSRRIVRY